MEVSKLYGRVLEVPYGILSVVRVLTLLVDVIFEAAVYES